MPAPTRLLMLCLLAGLKVCVTGCGTRPASDPCQGASISSITESNFNETGSKQALPLYRANGNPYEPGPLEVQSRRLTPCEAECPMLLDIYAPAAPGRYALIQFQHGFMVDIGYYSELLRHLASHGFVVVAPQTYPPGGFPFGQPSVEEEAAGLLAVADWASVHLDRIAGVATDPVGRGLAGHSRGGKVAWLAASLAPERFRALAGVDPMDGTLGGWTRVINGPFSFELPSLIIGAGLGSLPAKVPGVVCAPEGENHERFYAASPSPTWHAIVPEGGHADILNDDLSGCGPPCSYCPSGPNPAGMRQLTAGLLAAFFRMTLQDDHEAITYLTDPAAAPMLMTIESR